MKINLKVTENNVTETVQKEIEEINLLQLTNTIKIVAKVMKLAEEDENVKALIDEIAESQGEEAEEEAGQRVMQKVVQAFDVLLINLPEYAFQILSSVSGIDYELLMQQKIDDVFAVYDAILEVNDIPKLVDRGKKSLALTKKKFGAMNLLKAEQTAPQTQA